jgi:hypothetical protein
VALVVFRCAWTHPVRVSVTAFATVEKKRDEGRHTRGSKKVPARAAGTASLWVPKMKASFRLALRYFFFFAVFFAAFFFAGICASWKTFSLEGFRFGSLECEPLRYKLSINDS